MIGRQLATASLFAVCITGYRLAEADYGPLPENTLFPGPWEQYIKAPKNKTHITPARIYRVRGNVSTSSFEDGKHEDGGGLMLGAGGTLSLEFDENIAGRYVMTAHCIGQGICILLTGPEYVSMSKLLMGSQSYNWPTPSQNGLPDRCQMLPRIDRSGIFPLPLPLATRRGRCALPPSSVVEPSSTSPSTCLINNQVKVPLRPQRWIDSGTCWTRLGNTF